MITIRREVLERVIAHCRQLLPAEACGYLAEKNGVVCHHFELTNIDQAPDHFSMDAAEQFAALRQSRAQGLRLRAVYHSHPATPARPSAEDLRLATDPRLSYLIISFLAPAVAAKAFVIKNGAATPEAIEIIEPT